MRFPPPAQALVAKGRAVQHDDATVAQPRGGDANNAARPTEMAHQYPNHTRVVHHAFDGACALAYAVSQRGARRILSELAPRPPRQPIDMQYREFCQGSAAAAAAAAAAATPPPARNPRICLTTQPPLFDHWSPAGPRPHHSDSDSDSDIDIDTHAAYHEKGRSRHIRWSVRDNADSLIDGTGQYRDQWPDM